MFIVFIYIVTNASVFIHEFFRKQSYYNRLLSILKELDKRYLISELAEEPGFAEGQILYDVLKITNKSMNDEIAVYQRASKEYRDYIETWIHEIKTPIAAAKLMIENNRTDVLTSIENEIDNIEYYVEQTLYYAKSSNTEKDYIIKKVNLKDIVYSAVKKNSKLIIENRIELKIEEIEKIVYTDSKWTDFIINQILFNAVKYKAEAPKIIFHTEETENKVSLMISDNGIGICENDLGRVFDKGFTGENGRRYGKSTGIGLYLCKKLCDTLGMNISIRSETGKGTTVILIFPKNNMITMEP